MMGFLDFFRREKQDNSLDRGLANILLFSGTPSVANLINANRYGSDSAYSLTYAIANTNAIIARYIQLIADAQTNFTIINADGDEQLTGLGKIVRDEVTSLFGDEEDMTEFLYNSIRNFVACGMNITAPSIVSDNWHAVKLVALDNRNVRLEQNKEGTIECFYGEDKLNAYSKTLKKPSLNRQGYGDCLFSGAIDDVLIDLYSKLTVKNRYEKGGNPNLIYKIKDNKMITEDQARLIERKFKDKYHWIDNEGKSLVSDMIDDVIVLDTMDSVIKSVDIRLNASKNIGMMLGLDLRGLGWLREWGSEAELKAVRDSVNAEIRRRSELLSKDLTRSYEKLVAPLHGLSIKILPSYIKDNHTLLRLALDAYDKQILDKDYVENLLYNELS